MGERLWTSLSTDLFDEHLSLVASAGLAVMTLISTRRALGQGGAETVLLGSLPTGVSLLHPCIPGDHAPSCLLPRLLRRLPPALQWFYNVCTFSCSKIDGHNYPVPRRGTCGLVYVWPTSAETPRASPNGTQSHPPGPHFGMGPPAPHRQAGKCLTSCRVFTYNRGRKKNTYSSSVLLFQRGLEAWGETRALV